MTSSSSASFRKGDLVTYVFNWDDKGTVMVRDLVVHSCGKKQMVLVNAAGEKFQGVFFPPSGDLNVHGRVVHRLSVDAAHALGLEIAEGMLAYKREHFSDRMNRFADAGPGFHKAMAMGLAALHAPEVIRGEG